MTGAILIIAGCIVLEVARELCFKVSAEPLAAAIDSRSWSDALGNGQMWLGIFFWAAEVLLWIVALRFVPLGVAFPLMALSYALTPLASRQWLGERLSKRQLLGISLIVAGVASVGAGGI